MKMSRKFVAGTGLGLLACLGGVRARADALPATRPAAEPVDFSRQPTLYVVGYAHLDTQWRWSYPQVINQFIAETLHRNPQLLDKYPDYVFNFTGSRRYQMMKDYFPAEYERMKGYIKAGRWFPGGSNVDETDQNVPSAESVIRHVLYGNHFYQREFGVHGVDFLVPDCFGFPASLPSVLAHCSIKGFSTQKLRWGYSGGEPPFKVGVWEGTDGQSVVAALDPTGYGSPVEGDLTHDEHWMERNRQSAKQSNGLQIDYRYYGTGDRGGAPSESSVANLEKSVHGDGPLHIVSATSDQMFRDITPADRAKLPVYKGELLLTNHSTGSLTSQSFMKRMNRKNELLADSAERASVAAAWLGATPYPTRKLYESWMLMLECQQHDILPGDSLPKCYEYSWNDETVAANGFAAAEQDAVGAIASRLDTSASGVPLVVYNPLSAERQDVVEATVTFPNAAPQAVSVVGPDGKPCPTQIVERIGTDRLRILFLARVPGVSFATFDVQAGQAVVKDDILVSPLSVTSQGIENEQYRVTLNADGDVAQIEDKAHGNAPMLAAPLRLGFLHENPHDWPAWNMDWEDRKQPCQQYVDGPAQVRVVESGPVRVALEIVRQTRGSTFRQRVQLSAGDAGDRVEFPTSFDWRTPESSLEAVIPTNVSAPTATYDTQVGVVTRGNNDPKKFEVPQQQWFDITAPSGKYGVAVLNDSKYASDKPDDHTVRLTLVYTPGVRGGYQDQASQDFGRHQTTFALAGHPGAWNQGDLVTKAARLNQPLAVFQTRGHPGTLGRQFSLVHVSDPGVVVQAIKKAEDSDDFIIRLKETRKAAVSDLTLTFAAPVISAREVDGQEATLGDVTVRDGKIVTDIKPFHLRAFAFKLGDPKQAGKTDAGTPVTVPFDQDVVTPIDHLRDGAFDAAGHTYPAEKFPAELVSEGVHFVLGPTTSGAKNALACRGQTLTVPAGTRRVYLLAAASDGDTAGQFKVGDRTTEVAVQNGGGYIGQWDNRLWKGTISMLTYDWHNPLAGLTPGYIKRADVAWYADHVHDPEAGNLPWSYCYLFKYALDVPAGATAVTLPTAPAIKVFAVTAVADPHDDAVAARSRVDTLTDHTAGDAPQITVVPPAGKAAPPAGANAVYSDSVLVRIDPPLYWRDGGLRYTTDGSDPTPDSPVYVGPVPVAAVTTIKACEFDDADHASTTASVTVNVQDRTAPSVVAAEGNPLEHVVRLRFSEPVDKAAAERTDSYHFQPAVTLQSATLDADGCGVRLALDPSTTTLPPGLRLVINGVADLSPSRNAVRPEPVGVALVAPVVNIAAFSADGHHDFKQAVTALHRKGSEPWTINCFVKAAERSKEMIPIVGFGTCGHGASGTGRYICLFPPGLHYWSENADVNTDTNLGVGSWQMISAVYDGKKLTLYSNGHSIANRDVQLADDEDATVRLAPLDPWSGQHRFVGDMANATVWNFALSSNAVRALWETRPAQNR